MLVYGIQAFKPAPKFEDFCKGNIYERAYPKPYIDGIAPSCPFNRNLQQATDQCNAQGGIVAYSYNDTGCPIAVEECNLCQKQFDEERAGYEKLIFVVAIVVGIITLLIGFGILSVEPVGSALMASGVGAIVYGAARNWENLSNIWRFLLLLAALILLIWIALRLNRDKKKWRFWRR